MKKLLAALSAVAMLLATLGASPASADKPFVIEDSDEFVDVNPCTGLEMDIRLDFVVAIHEHRNTLVVKIDRSGETSDGSITRNGTETDTFNAMSEIGHISFMDTWYNPETGAKFMARGVGVAVLEDGPFAEPTEIRVERFSLSCIGGPTMLP